MNLKTIIIKNFRGYAGEYRIPVGNLTAFIGKNDAGKSTILDALGIYAMGRGVKRDFEIAFRYYQKAANLGDSYGMHMVGVMYYDGLGVRRNYKRAVDYFRRALEHGETQALYYLGTCYRDGLGVRQDVDKARQYLAEGKRMVFQRVVWRRLCWSWMRLLHRKSWTEWLPCWKKPGPCWMSMMKKCCSTSSCWRALLKSSERSSLPV